MPSIQLKLIDLDNRVRKLLKEENGITAIGVILIIIAVAVLLVIIFKENIKAALEAKLKSFTCTCPPCTSDSP